MKIKPINTRFQIDKIPPEVYTFCRILEKHTHTITENLLDETVKQGRQYQMKTIQRVFSLVDWIRFFRFCQFLGLFVVWLGAGFYSASKQKDLCLWAFLFSFGILLWSYCYLIRQDFRNNYSLFYFCSDETQNADSDINAYLSRIRNEKAGFRKYSFINHLFPEPIYALYLRVPSGYEALSQKKLHKLFDILGMIVRFTILQRAKSRSDFLPVHRFMMTQHLPQISVALTSLWALSCGLNYVVKPLLTWSILVLTLLWFWHRMTIFLQSFRVWAPTFPHLYLHPIFEQIQIIHPVEAVKWQNYRPLVVSFHDQQVRWILHGVIGVYLVLFFGMVTWNFNY